MNKERMVEEFKELVAIDTASRKETQIAAIVKDKLYNLGFEVSQDKAGEAFGGECGNVLGIREGELPGALLLCSHLDRVPNGFGIKPVEKDGIMYSDGTTILAADDISGVCCILEGLRQVLDAGIPLPRLEVLFTVSEEAGLNGAKAFDVSKLKAKIGYIFDSPGPVGRFVNEAPGRYALKAEITGLAAHAGNEPEKGIDAGKVMCDILSTLSTGRLDSESTANFPILRTASTATNVVCDSASFAGETRSRNRAKLQEYVEYFKNHCEEVAAKAGAKINLTMDEVFVPFVIGEEELATKIVREAAKKQNLDCVINAGGGGMDANIFNAKGLTCMGVATGYTKNHTSQEQLVLADFYKAGDLAAELIKEFGRECK